MMVDDVNSDRTGGYTVFNLRAGWSSVWAAGACANLCDAGQRG